MEAVHNAVGQGRQKRPVARMTFQRGAEVIHAVEFDTYEAANRLRKQVLAIDQWQREGEIDGQGYTLRCFDIAGTQLKQVAKYGIGHLPDGLEQYFTSSAKSVQ